MSNGRSHRRRVTSTTRTSAKELIAAAKADARRLGCTCAPDFNFVAHGDRFSHLTVAHDDWCRAANGRSALIVKLPPKDAA
ncbi:MAG: hypothetical protein AB7L13_23915 [Acidimicrobiia bacterium]